MHSDFVILIAHSSSFLLFIKLQSDKIVRIEMNVVFCSCLNELIREHVEPAGFVTHVNKYGMSVK